MKEEGFAPLTPGTVPVQETETESLTPFDSLDDLAASHKELLDRQTSPEHQNDPNFLSDVKELIARGRQGGALVENIAERRTAQSLLNYWITVLGRAGENVPDATLVPFVPLAKPINVDFATLKCPYIGLNAFTEADHSGFYGR